MYQLTNMRASISVGSPTRMEGTHGDRSKILEPYFILYGSPLLYRADFGTRIRYNQFATLLSNGSMQSRMESGLLWRWWGRRLGVTGWMGASRRLGECKGESGGGGREEGSVGTKRAAVQGAEVAKRWRAWPLDNKVIPAAATGPAPREDGPRKRILAPLGVWK